MNSASTGKRICKKMAEGSDNKDVRDRICSSQKAKVTQGGIFSRLPRDAFNRFLPRKTIQGETVRKFQIYICPYRRGETLDDQKLM